VEVHNGATTNYTYDDADQMTAAGGVTYTYDNNGNQTGRGADTFGWDAENRLTSTNLGGTAGSYTYNGDGHRMSRTIGGASASAVTTAFQRRSSRPRLSPRNRRMPSGSVRGRTSSDH
jgi:YD repeat-containing protein